MLISREDPATADIVALLEEHLADMHAESPPESVHAVDVQRLREPHVTFLAARDDGGRLLGVGALAELTADHAELKSMRTNPAFRGQGVAASVLSQLLAIASERGYERVSLETGTQQYFAAACRLYERAGFTECEPFGTYAEDPFSRFYTVELGA